MHSGETWPSYPPLTPPQPTHQLPMFSLCMCWYIRKVRIILPALRLNAFKNNATAAVHQQQFLFQFGIILKWRGASVPSPLRFSTMLVRSIDNYFSALPISDLDLSKSITMEHQLAGIVWLDNFCCNLAQAIRGKLLFNYLTVSPILNILCSVLPETIIKQISDYKTN